MASALQTMDWFLYDRDLSHEIVKSKSHFPNFLNMDSLYKILNNTTRHTVTRKRRKRREESRKAHYKEPIKKESLET